MARQQNLFDTEPAPWEVDAQQTVLTATVYLPTVPGGPFDYSVPSELSDTRNPGVLAEAGRRVLVPLGRGNRRMVAYCVAVESKVCSRKLKPIAGVIDKAPLLSPAMLRLTKWMADYYLCPWGAVLEAVLPSGVRGKAGTREVKLFRVPTKVIARLTTLDVTDKQRKVLEVLASSNKPLLARQLIERAECGIAVVNALCEKGFVEVKQERLDTDPLTTEPVARRGPHKLMDDQARALRSIGTALDSREQQTLLLHGVTGSGKTEVYIQAIEKVVGFGRQAIVLVPEISLTPQTVARFRERFDGVAVLHSHQSDVERHREWRRIASTGVQVVVGARSAVFAPTKHLGLIIIDEEHESTFKQDTAPRYHARDVALWRTHDLKIPLVLGTATPSLESWHRATMGEFELVDMPRRVSGRSMPGVQVVDMIEERQTGPGRFLLSRRLQQSMTGTLKELGQIILLLNRRGYSTHMQCPACSHVVSCPDCDTALTFHRVDNSVICHWCEYREVPPSHCPECKDNNIRYSGSGTQQLEAAVRARFPGEAILRMDSDTMRKKGSHETALDAFRRGDYSILVGTQMIAKGLDFPNVTLVGVVNADVALHRPDFRAAERTFQLVTQVAGRTGRGDAGGRVIVQTLQPEHIAIAASQQHNYKMMADAELPIREVSGYPPFGVLYRLVVRSELESHAVEFAKLFCSQVQQTFDTAGARLRVRGPSPASIPKLRSKFRYHALLLSPSRETLHNAVEKAIRENPPPPGVEFIVDVDPAEMV